MSNPPVVPVHTQNFLQRVTQAAKLMKIEDSALLSALEELGVSKDDPDAVALLESDAAQEGDARRILVDPPKGVVKIIPFKAGWSILKGKANKSNVIMESNSTSELVKALRPIGQYSDEELLANYDESSSSDMVNELSKRCKDRSFVVFGNDQKIDVKASLHLLRLSKRQEIPPTYMLDGKMVRVYRIGEFPMAYLEECPIHRNVLLLDGYCDQCKNSWKEVSMGDRTLVAVAIENNLDGYDTPSEIDRLITDLRKGQQFWHPEVHRIYTELQTENALPTLRRKLSSNGKSDPFFVHRKH